MDVNVAENKTLRIGDIVKRTLTRTGKIYKILHDIWKDEGGQVQVVVITHENAYYIEKKIAWYYNNCELISNTEKTESKTCQCNIQILMKKGCQCGKI